MKQSIIDKLEKMGACDSYVEWMKKQKSMSEAWANCDRGDRMVWLLGKKAGKVGSKNRKKLGLCLADVAELALPHAGKNKKVCNDTIAVLRSYCHGDATLEWLIEARKAAYDAAFADDAVFAAYAAAVAVEDAVDVAAYAAYDTADAVAKTRAEAADIVRKHYPEPPRL